MSVLIVDMPSPLQVGLCLSLKNLPWFEEREAETFLPRCYRICADEEKEAFVGKNWFGKELFVDYKESQKEQKMTCTVLNWTLGHTEHT